MASLANLAPAARPPSAGFPDPVRDAQAVFRGAMAAMAEPGRVLAFKPTPRPPDPLAPSLAALALALADHETPLWLDRPLAAAPEVAAYLRFHTGARIVAEPAEAAFALCADPARLPPFATFAQGSLDYPDRSATLILAVDALEGDGGWRLTGPGIAGQTRFRASPVPPDMVDRLSSNRALFPRGLDLIFAAPAAVAALPRSTRVEP